MRYKIILLNPAQYPALQHLFWTAFKKRVSLSAIAAKYDTRYLGIEPPGYVAFAPDGSPAAYYGGLPFPIHYGKTDEIAFQSCDTMTAPAHRGKGLFPELAEQTYERCVQLGISFAFGFANENSFPGFVNKLQFQTLHHLQRTTIALARFPVAVLFQKIPLISLLHRQMLLSKAVIEPIYNGGGENEGKGYVLKSPAFINYKTTFGNSFSIGLGNSLFWLKIQGGDMLLGYWTSRSGNDLNIRDLYRLIALLTGAGFRHLIYQGSPDTNITGLLARYFPVQTSLPVIYRPFKTAIPPDLLRFAYCDFDTF